MNTESRLIRLEENQAFQEIKLDGLHSALLEQQTQIDRLEARLREQLGKIMELQESMQSQNSRPNEKPPHYL